MFWELVIIGANCLYFLVSLLSGLEIGSDSNNLKFKIVRVKMFYVKKLLEHTHHNFKFLKLITAES